jgi:chemotaxis protein MotB
MGRDGLIISLREAGFFNSGSATPRPETLTTMQQIVASVGRTQGKRILIAICQAAM